jgi:hypothetical protein
MALNQLKNFGYILPPDNSLSAFIVFSVFPLIVDEVFVYPLRMLGLFKPVQFFSQISVASNLLISLMPPRIYLSSY